MASSGKEIKKKEEKFMGIYFIADTHFDDERILAYEKRPYKTASDMTNELIQRWNETIHKEDIVYHIGDVGNQEIIKKLNGVKYLIKGNHDVLTNEEYRNCGFLEVYDHPIIIENFWILSHEPMYVNTNMPYANIFGHVHNSPLYKTYSKQHYCVSVERIDYQPIAFETIKKAVM